MKTLPSRETLRTILSSPQAARTERQRRRVPTGTDGDLLAFVEETFGLRIPAVACCPGHMAPAFCDAYFSRAPVAVWKASRGFGGKSTLLATLALTEAITRPADVTVLGGSAQQSERVLEAMTRLWRAAQGTRLPPRQSPPPCGKPASCWETRSRPCPPPKPPCAGRTRSASASTKPMRCRCRCSTPRTVSRWTGRACRPRPSSAVRISTPTAR